MEADPVAFRHWEDVVFENRNKLYGAYLLRRTYANHLLSGVGVTLVLVSVILSMNDMPSDRPFKRLPLPTGEETIVTITHPPPKDERSKERPPAPKKPQTEINRILITKENVIQPDSVEPVTDFEFNDDMEFGETFATDGDIVSSEPEPPSVAEPEVLVVAEVMPSYEGGFEALIKFITKNIKYPRAPRRIGVEGTVYVGFVVGANGSVRDVHIVKGIHPDCDSEAMRVVSMLPMWRAGSHNGKPVSVRMVLPIKFDLAGQ